MPSLRFSLFRSLSLWSPLSLCSFWPLWPILCPDTSLCLSMIIMYQVIEWLELLGLKKDLDPLLPSLTILELLRNKLLLEGTYNLDYLLTFWGFNDIPMFKIFEIWSFTDGLTKFWCLFFLLKHGYFFCNSDSLDKITILLLELWHNLLKIQNFFLNFCFSSKSSHDFEVLKFLLRFTFSLHSGPSPAIAGGDAVDYGAYTGGYGAFGWYSDHPNHDGIGHRR